MLLRNFIHSLRFHLFHNPIYNFESKKKMKKKYEIFCEIFEPNTSNMSFKIYSVISMFSWNLLLMKLEILLIKNIKIK